jgi:TetR/AcrR family transcriptional regulator, tetracycline repressor protein
MTEISERTRLSRETVVDGALALIDQEGLDALTIRGLAQRLGVTPMALYWHYKNKDQLLDGLVNRLWSLVDTDVDAGETWIDQLRSLMVSLVSVMRAHPASAPLVMDTEPEDAEACFDTMEVALELLRGAGFSARQSADVCRHGLRTAITLAVGGPGHVSASTTEAVRRKRIILQSLPPDRYPRVIEASAPLTDYEDADAYYEFGIDLFISGVEALAPRR